MITHVASAGENRGRVVLQLSSACPSQIALEAAFHIARAFESEIDSLFVEDSQIFDICHYTFTREISLSGQQNRNLASDTVEHDMRLAAAAMRRQIAHAAKRAGVVVHFDVVRDEPVTALASACAASGPWNVVAIADPLRPGHGPQIARMFQAVTGTTGIVFVGPRARRISGPVIVVAESIERLAGMLRTAERLSSNTGDVILLMIGENEDELHLMEGQMRLALGPELSHVKLAITEVTRGRPEVIAEALRRLGAGFVIGQFGGQLVPAEGDMKAILTVLECPLLLTP